MSDIELHRDGSWIDSGRKWHVTYAERGDDDQYAACVDERDFWVAVVALLDAERAEDARKADDAKVEALARKLESTCARLGSVEADRLARIAIDHLEGR